MSSPTIGKAEIEKDLHIYYELHGNGHEKVLLVMGLGTSANAWLNNVRWLVENEEDYQFCIYDNRGIGRSSVPSGRYTTSIMASDAIKLCDYLQWDYFHVAGVSMGGMISQEITLQALDRVKTLNLGVTHSGQTGSFTPWGGVSGILQSLFSKTLEQKAEIVMRMMYTEEYLNEIIDGISNMERFCKLYIESLQSLPPPQLKGYLSQVLAVKTHCVKKNRLLELKESNIPIVICTGTTDVLVNPKASYHLKEILNPSEFIVWEKTGHGIITQQFDEYNSALIRNCKRNPIKIE